MNNWEYGDRRKKEAKLKNNAGMIEPAEKVIDEKVENYCEKIPEIKEQLRLIEEKKKEVVSIEKTLARNALTAKKDRLMVKTQRTLFRILAIKFLKQLVPASLHTEEEYERNLGKVIDWFLQNKNQSKEDTHMIDA